MKWIVALIGMVGCVGEPDVEVVDQGRICAWAFEPALASDPNAAQGFEADQPLWVTA